MTASSKLGDATSLDASIPAAAAPLESILCTEELHRRPSRPPDYEKENRALVNLVSALADSPGTILQTLADTILDITQCDSAGLSLLTRDGKTADVRGKRFFWPAIAGMWNPHAGGGTPRNFGPCGTCSIKTVPCCSDISNVATPICCRSYRRPKNASWSRSTSPARRSEPSGRSCTADRRKFDAEDDRVMASLGKFASSAYQALIYIEDLKVQVSQRENGGSRSP
jgi:hypothetical protein